MNTSNTTERLATVMVIYPAAMQYFKEFIRNYEKQTELVPLLIYSDGVDREIIELELKDCNFKWQFQALPRNLNVSQNRIEVLKSLSMLPYAWFLFIDADDLMSENRIEISLKNLDGSADILYNQITLLSGGPYFMRSLPPKLMSIHDIARGNFVGLSAVSIKKSAIQSAMHWLHYGATCIAFDWFLMSVLLFVGAKGRLLFECETYYRIYNENTAGDLWLTSQKYLTERKVKQLHYTALASFYPEASSTLFEMIEVQTGLSDNLEKYIDFINTTQKRFWWSCVDDLEVYRLFLDFSKHK